MAVTLEAAVDLVAKEAEADAPAAEAGDDSFMTKLSLWESRALRPGEGYTKVPPRP